MIIRYTGARRGAVARSKKDSRDGLRWPQVDWMRNVIRFHHKKKRKNPSMHSELRTILIEAYQRYGQNNPEGHVIPYTRDTLTRYFKDGMSGVRDKKSWRCPHS